MTDGTEARTTKIGLDIGTYAIKMVELLHRKDGYTLMAYDHQKEQGRSRDVLVERIRSMCAKAGVGTTRVNIALSGPDVVTRFVHLPWMPEREMRSALVFEVEKNIACGIDEAVYDFKVLTRGKKEGVQVLLAMAKREYVMRFVDIVERCGLKPENVDVDAFAVANAFLNSYRGYPHDKVTVALVNIGHRHTDLDILHRDILGLSRDIAMGGSHIDEAIARLLSVDAAAAERLKREPAERANEVALAVRMAAAHLVDELKMAFNYFKDKAAAAVECLYLSGGSAPLKALQDFLAAELGIPLVVCDPFRMVGTRDGGGDPVPEDLRCGFGVSVGLAMR